MNGRHCWSLVLFGVLLFLAPRAADACSCIPANPACGEVWRTTAVFAGRVLAIDSFSQLVNLTPGRSVVEQLRHVRLRVIEAFKGVQGSEVTIVTGVGGGDCGFTFDVGADFLVYAEADRVTGALQTGICTRTKSLDRAANDLTYLRGLPTSSETAAHIFGTVLQWDPDANGGQPRTKRPFGGANVRADGVAGHFQAVSAADGTYDLRVPAGSYQLTFTVPRGWYVSQSLRRGNTIDLPDRRACSQIDASVHSDGHVSGRVRDRRGRPVPGLSIELARSDRLDGLTTGGSGDLVGRTGPDGRFDIGHVPPASYVVELSLASERPVSRILFSDDRGPRVCAIIDGQRLDAGDLRVPETTDLVRVTGVVHDSAGRPLEGADVYLESDSPILRIVGRPITTGRDGRFTFSAPGAFGYRLAAELRAPIGSSPNLWRSDIVVLGPRNTGPLVLMIRR